MVHVATCEGPHESLRWLGPIPVHKWGRGHPVWQRCTGIMPLPRVNRR